MACGTVPAERIYALIIIEHDTRRAHLAGITAYPDGAWTTQAARNFLMDLGQRAASVKFLIRDRAGQVTDSFDAVFTAEGIRILVSPPQAPRANAICERIIGTLRRELFDRLLIVSEHYLPCTDRVPDPLQLRATAPRLGAAAAGPSTSGQPRSTWPSTGSVENKSSGASSASTRSPPDSHEILREVAGHSHIRVFEPRRVMNAATWPLDCRIGT